MQRMTGRRAWPMRYIFGIALVTVVVNLVLDARLKGAVSRLNRTDLVGKAISQFELVKLRGQLQHETKICYDFRQPEYRSLKFVAGVEKGVLENTHFEFEFRSHRESLLLAAEVDLRQSTNTRKDHLIVLLLRGKLFLLADAGQVPVFLSVSQPNGFHDDAWHRVSVTKAMYRIRLLVDSGSSFPGVECPGSGGSSRGQLCNVTVLREGSVSINTNSGLQLLSIERKVLDAVKSIATRSLGLGSGVLDIEKGVGCVQKLAVRGKSFFSRDLVRSVAVAAKPEGAAFVPLVDNVKVDLLRDRGSQPIQIRGQTFRQFRAGGNKTAMSEMRLHRAPIITGISDNHFSEVVDMIASSHYHMAKKMIVVYNLGLKLHSLNQLKTFCWVKLRNVDFSQYPSHVQWLKACAWKPIIIKAALDEFPAVIYCDASTRFNGHISQLLPLWQSVGFLARQTLGPASAYTHRQTYAEFNASADDYRHVAMAAAGVLLISGVEYVRMRIVEPWVSCAVRAKCIVPAGLEYPPCKRGANAYDYRCPRFDQSALALLLYKVFGDRQLRPAMTNLVANITRTVRHPTHDYRVKICK